MEVKSEYLIASFFSFLIHALIILYLMDFFYSEKQIRPVLSQTVDVNLIFEEEIIKPKKLPEAVKVPSVNQVVDKDINIEQDIKPTNTDEINISINDLIKIDKMILLIQTLFPEPVAPAISTCGIFPKFMIIDSPVIVFPNPAINLSDKLNTLDSSIMERKVIICTS